MYIEEDIDQEKILTIVHKYNSERSGLIAMLQEIQTECGYLPEKALRTIGKELNCSLGDVYGVATFYHSFSLKPRGKHHIRVCLGTACHVRGAQRIVEEFEKQLDIKPGMTTANKNFSLETVNCLGACALGPVVVIGKTYFSKVKKSKVVHLIDETLKKDDIIRNEKDKSKFPIDAKCPHCYNRLMDELFLIDGYPSIKIAISFNNDNGWLRLSSIYGSYNASSLIDIPVGATAKFTCPHCGKNLHDTFSCSLCKAPMIVILIDGNEKILICSRKGCKNHILDLDHSKIKIIESYNLT